MTTFLTSNKPLYRLLRTILQGIIGVFVAYADVIFGGEFIPAEYKPIAVGIVMAILSPVMALLNEADTIEIDDDVLKELEATYDEDRGDDNED